MKKFISAIISLSIFISTMAFPVFSETATGNVSISYTNPSYENAGKWVINNTGNLEIGKTPFFLPAKSGYNAFDIGPSHNEDDYTIDDMFYHKDNEDYTPVTIIQPYENPGKMSLNYKSDDLLLSFTIDKTAEVFIGVKEDDSVPLWLAKEGFEEAYTKNNKRVKIMTDWAYKYNMYKKSFVVKEGETKTFDFYGTGKDLKSPLPVIIKWYDNNLLKINVKGEGEVKSDNIDVSNTTLLGFKGLEKKLIVSPVTSNYIKSIFINNEEYSFKNPFGKEEITYNFNGKNEEINIEFSNEYDFSHVELSVVPYTDTDGTVKQKIKVSGTTDEFLKDFKVSAHIECKENKKDIEGTVGENGKYEFSDNIDFTGDCNVKLYLIFDETTKKEVASSLVTIKDLKVINDFIKNMKNKGEYSYLALKDDLKNNGTELGFDTELYNMTTEENKEKIAGKIFNEEFKSIEDTIALYNLIVPLYSLNFVDNKEVIYKALFKYIDFYDNLKEDKRYDYYNTLENKDNVINYLLNKEYKSEKDFKNEFIKAVIADKLSKIVNSSNIDEIIIENSDFIPEKLYKKYRNLDRLTRINILRNIEESSLDNYDEFIKELNTKTDKAIKDKNNSQSHSHGSSGGGGSSKVTVNGKIPEKKPQVLNLFKDVSEKAWYYDSLKYLVSLKIVETDDYFYPENPCTRGDFVNLIMKVYKKDIKNDSEISFSDVSKDDPLYEVIKNAKNAGIIEGISENYFGKDLPLTREDAAVIIVRMLEKREDVKIDKKVGSLDFDDAKDVSSYAESYVKTLTDIKVIAGYDNLFLPKNLIKRCEGAQLIYNIITNDSILSTYLDNLSAGKREEEDDFFRNEDDFLYNQGGMKPDYVEGPVPHPVPDVININYMGKYIYMKDYPVIIKDTTFIPVREISEMLKGEVLYNDKTNEVTIKVDNKEIKLKANDKSAYVNGKLCTLDKAPLIIKERLYVPLRFIGENLSLDVKWNEAEKTVYLK